MGIRKTQKPKSMDTTIITRVPYYLNNAILHFAKEKNLSKSNAIRNLLFGGINFYMSIDKEKEK
jgi:hypothetical protein